MAEELKAGTEQSGPEPKQQKSSRLGVLLIFGLIVLLLAAFLVLRPHGATSSPSGTPASAAH